MQGKNVLLQTFLALSGLILLFSLLFFYTDSRQRASHPQRQRPLFEEIEPLRYKADWSPLTVADLNSEGQGRVVRVLGGMPASSTPLGNLRHRISFTRKDLKAAAAKRLSPDLPDDEDVSLDEREEGDDRLILPTEPAKSSQGKGNKK